MKQVPATKRAGGIFTIDQILKFVRKEFRKKDDWVYIFFDGRDKLETAYIHHIAGKKYCTPKTDWTICKNGDGDKPLFYITKEDYDEFKSMGITKPNSYGGFHRRRIYEFDFDAMKSVIISRN